MSDNQAGGSGMQDLTVCPICYVQFERPMQLSCGHSFCSKCIEKLRKDCSQSQSGGTSYKYEVPCPKCRRVTKIPPGGLPVNYTLQGIFLLNRQQNVASCSCIDCWS
ncbi:zinc finger, C3HC4 type [Oesophagostomum dentatum]|uniref:Zinc finger, C3HC4 type n=1 Tax=Oesophagostomum dentatum TaxID=61180 RepID=A0A0B1TGC9_OESDE|nr:zinc finger, C3HC4 type [Oesophagostomum dentatum]